MKYNDFKSTVDEGASTKLCATCLLGKPNWFEFLHTVLTHGSDKRLMS